MCVYVCVYAHAGARSSQGQSAALCVTETKFSLVPELNHRSNHLEYKDFHPARSGCPICFSQLQKSCNHLLKVNYTQNI